MGWNRSIWVIESAYTAKGREPHELQFEPTSRVCHDIDRALEKAEDLSGRKQGRVYRAVCYDATDDVATAEKVQAEERNNKAIWRR